MDSQGVGPLVYLLPYLEQDAVFKNFSFRPNLYPLYYDTSLTPGGDGDGDPLNCPLSTYTDNIPRPPALYGCEPTISTFLCPADDAQSSVTALWGINYGNRGLDYPVGSPNIDIGGSHRFARAPGRRIMGRSNYLASAGYYAQSIYPQYRGFFYYKSKNSIAKIPDGTSNTTMFMEYTGGFVVWGGSGGRPDGISNGSWSTGPNFTGFGTIGNEYYLFGSRHTGGMINAGYGDGSVRQIQQNIDFSTWVYLSGIADGVVITGIDN
jgi:prepilin-type processing-associated H-X9-DG protein